MRKNYALWWLMLAAVVVNELYLLQLEFAAPNWHARTPFVLGSLAILAGWLLFERYRNHMPWMYAVLGLIMMLTIFIR